MTPEGIGSRTRKCFLNVYLNVFAAACSPERTLLALPTLLNLCPNFEKSSTKTQLSQPRWRCSLRRARQQMRVTIGLPLVSRGFESGRSRLCELHSRSCISKVEKEILSLTTPASGMRVTLSAIIQAYFFKTDHSHSSILF